ncbi:MAG: hypothetical protein WC374_14155 [Phycisphaerae bacterium]|jgi:division protein CdvB (Snf7/Vps24/ESCRT-III family)
MDNISKKKELSANDLSEIKRLTNAIENQQLTIELNLQKNYLEMAQNKIKEIESILGKFEQKQINK